MQLRKIISVAAFIGLSGLSFAAAADTLTTLNYTDHESAVRVTSGMSKGKCTGTLPAGLAQFTPAGTATVPGKGSVEWTSVGALCLFSSGDCTADIYMTRDCSDAVVAHASLNLTTHVVTVNQAGLESPYKVVVSAGSTLEIRKSA